MERYGFLYQMCLVYNELFDGYQDHDVVEAIIWHLVKTYFNDYGFENADNLRIAEANNPADMYHYEEARKQGCCGFHDATITTKGRTFMVGFNYGH